MLGLRYLMDVVPLDATLVRGSHGLKPANPLDGPVLISDARDGIEIPLAMTGLKQWLLKPLRVT
jgi:hypothetical protein